MTELQEKILKGTIAMYNNCGEMVPTKLFNDNSNLDELSHFDKVPKLVSKLNLTNI